MVAQRYGSEVPSAYEIWNEPNTTSFWAPSANPANYVAVQKDAYTAIKAIRPTQTVVSGGLAPEDTSNGNMDAVQFLSAVYADGGGYYFDAVGDHPYSWPALPNDVESWSGWDQLSYDSTSIRSVMMANVMRPSRCG
jgi:polysaccharide biosynthesis protein PslG